MTDNENLITDNENIIIHTENLITDTECIIENNQHIVKVINFNEINVYFEHIPFIETIIYNKNDNDVIIFNNNNTMIGATSYYFTDDQKKYFLKIPYNKIKNWDFLNYDILKREIYILTILSKYEQHFPKLIDYNEFGIITEFIGDILCEKNIPSNILTQIETIINILNTENISHRDIKKEELLIKDNILYIVDWGWSTINNDFSCGINLCSLEKPFLNTDSDVKCILKIISDYL